MKIRADRRVGLLLAGVVVLTFLALGATVALPASDPTVRGEPRKLDAEQQRGLDIFRSEGLWMCEPAYQRETSVDRARTGADATTAEDVSGMSPVMLGLERITAGDRTAGAVASDCGVKLSESETAAVQAFLDARAGSDARAGLDARAGE